MTDNLSEDAKRRLEANRELKAESQRQFADRMKGKPTPTQEECDRAMLGEHIMEHEADGSDPDPTVVERHMEARPGSGYQTRQGRPAPPVSKPSSTG